MKKSISFLILSILSISLFAQKPDSLAIRKIFDDGLTKGKAYPVLSYMCTHIGQRLSGSENADKAVTYMVQQLKICGADSVWLLPCMVTHWVRGDKEKAFATSTKLKKSIALPCCALGGSVGTGPNGISGNVIEVHSIDEVKTLTKEKVKGKIIFYDGAFDATLLNTFQAYGNAVGQRHAGAIEAAKLGAVGVLVRSMTTDHDDLPHTGAMAYDDSVKKIPAIAISTNSADSLDALLTKDPDAKVIFKTTCQTLPDVPSHDVVAEIKGSEYPNEVIVVGGHLDSWDLAQGASDDGAGVVQSMEVLRLFKSTGIRPKHTIRVVLFMNEEHGGQGADAYAKFAKNSGEKAMAAFETDRGGFAPRGFSFDSMAINIWNYINQWRPLLASFNCGEYVNQGSGYDVGKLNTFCPLVGELYPDPQRYFHIHHNAADVIENVDSRELELGSTSLAALIFLVDEHGLPGMN